MQLHVQNVCSIYFDVRSTDKIWEGWIHDGNSREILWFQKMKEERLILIKRKVTGD